MLTANGCLTFLHHFHVGTKQCNKNFTDQIGVIASPAYPNLYPSRQDCDYRIYFNTSQFYLDFEYISIEPSALCNYDYVKITSRSHNLTHCRNLTNIKLSIESSSALVTFHSDVYINYFGFLAMYYPSTGIFIIFVFYLRQAFLSTVKR